MNIDREPHQDIDIDFNAAESAAKFNASDLDDAINRVSTQDIERVVVEKDLVKKTSIKTTVYKLYEDHKYKAAVLGSSLAIAGAEAGVVYSQTRVADLTEIGTVTPPPPEEETQSENEITFYPGRVVLPEDSNIDSLEYAQVSRSEEFSDEKREYVIGFTGELDLESDQSYDFYTQLKVQVAEDVVSTYYGYYDEADGETKYIHSDYVVFESDEEVILLSWSEDIEEEARNAAEEAGIEPEPRWFDNYTQADWQNYMNSGRVDRFIRGGNYGINLNADRQGSIIEEVAGESFSLFGVTLEEPSTRTINGMEVYVAPMLFQTGNNSPQGEYIVADIIIGTSESLVSVTTEPNTYGMRYVEGAIESGYIRPDTQYSISILTFEENKQESFTNLLISENEDMPEVVQNHVNVLSQMVSSYGQETREFMEALNSGDISRYNGLTPTLAFGTQFESDVDSIPNTGL